MAKRKSGARYKNGRLKQATTLAGRQAWDYGNTIVADRVEHYNAMAYQGGGHGAMASDGVGLMWLCGILDGVHPNLSGKDLFDAVRLYGELLAEEYPFLATQIASYDRQSRTSGDGWENLKRRNLFQRMEAAMTKSQRSHVRELLTNNTTYFAHRGIHVPYWAMTFVHQFQGQRGLLNINELVRLPDSYDERAKNTAIAGMCALFDQNLESRRAA